MSEWEYKKLQNLCDVRDGTHDSPKYHETGVPFITSKNLTTNGIDFNNVSYISVENHKSFSIRSKVERGDILFGMIGTIGKPVIVNVDFEFSIKNVALLKFGHSNKELINEFAIQVLNSNIIEEQFRNKSDGGVQSFISLSAIRNLDIPVPPLPQQQKIARILSTVDAVIEKTEAAIAKYKAIKAGMMHDLFTRGIDENGQLRPSYQQAPHLYKPSKLGWIPKDWEINELITVAKDNQYSFTGGPFGSDLKSSDYTKRGVRIIQLQNIGDGCFLNSYKIYTSEEKADNLSSCNIFPNNIIIAKMADPVARACIMPTFDNRYLMASDGIRLEVDEKRFNVSFVKESINSPYFRSRAINLSTGTTRARIGLSALKSILIKHPLLNEQNSISQKIETIDKKIELEQTTLNKYQKLKQGLMQDLLTGEVTVSV
ncbi:MAG: restriction endonuclease subunit S [Methylococcales bacterium]|nr:restriction endonuclease subunit S [Methylococcales bacterium]